MNVKQVSYFSRSNQCWPLTLCSDILGINTAAVRLLWTTRTKDQSRGLEAQQLMIAKRVSAIFIQFSRP